MISSLLSRFQKFFFGLLEGSSLEVSTVARLAARDIRSNLGSNLQLMKEISGRDPWDTGLMVMKNSLIENCVREVPSQDFWRVPYLQELLELRLRAYYHCNKEEEDELTAMIDSLVKN